MKKALLTAAALIALPMATQAQSLQPGGFYIGAEGGLNWLLSNSFNTTVTVPGVGSASATTNGSYNTGWLAGGMIGYDFIGPRVELEGVYRANTGTLTVPGLPGSLNGFQNQVSIMANVLYDFNAGGTIVPYIGVGAGVAFLNAGDSSGSANATAFAYQAILGVGYNIDSTFRLNLEGRYYGTTTPNYSYSGNVGGFPYTMNANPTDNNFSLMASIQLKFGAPSAAVPPPPPPMVSPPSFMVFFDWDRSNLSAQALNTIKQAAAAYKSKGSARVTATGHTDTSGPEAYNMALSLRRANTVKDALVREGVPATAISVVGRGKSMPLVQTGDGVREPQNRRVEIVIQ
jgi:outer membrane protein OmpA-like peptidoglycan-associated protein